METVHGLEVIKWVADHGPQEKSALLSNLREHFGATTEFHTCSATELPLEVLVDFFVQNGKLSDTAGNIGVPADFACDC